MKGYRKYRVSDPKIHLSNSLSFSFSSQFSSSMNGQFSYSLIFSFNCIFWISTWCYLSRITFTSKSLIADFLIQLILLLFPFWNSTLWLFRSLDNDLTKMLAKLPVEIILLICEYPESKELKQLARTSTRMMQIIKKHLPKALKRKILVYRRKILLVWAKVNFSI